MLFSPIRRGKEHTFHSAVVSIKLINTWNTQSAAWPLISTQEMLPSTNGAEEVAEYLAHSRLSS